MANMQLLKELYLFKDLTDSEVDIISNAAEVQTFQTGDEVFCTKEVANSLYVVQQGSIRITITEENGENVEVARLSKGSHFGEMPFLDAEPRSATATALEPSELVVINYDKLANLMIENPGMAVHVYRQFATFLCGRLRHTTKDLAFTRSKVLSHF